MSSMNTFCDHVVPFFFRLFKFLQIHVTQTFKSILVLFIDIYVIDSMMVKFKFIVLF